MFDEAFSLRQIFIPLRAYSITKVEKRENLGEFIGNGEADGKDELRTVVNLSEDLDAWIEKADAKDSLRIISGGPGSGKSSFAKLFAVQQSGKAALRTIFIPLHQFDMKNDLIEAVGDFVRSQGILSYNPGSTSMDRRVLLIFDGLDELAMRGKVAEQLARDFVREVRTTLDLRNHSSCSIQAIISGRELVVQSNSAEIRRPRQILHLLPYIVTEPELRQFSDPRKLLSVDQRHAWWEKYNELTGQTSAGMPPALIRQELQEVTAQPLLNYLIALSFSRGKIDFTKQSNLNLVYEDLIRAVYERGWAEQQHVALSGMTSDNFVRVLEEIGIAAWHGDGRTTTVAEIERHCAQTGLSKYLEIFSEGAKSGVTRLLTAFYFRQRGRRQDGDATFEFTHKSFGEYLAARRIVRAIDKIHKEYASHISDPDGGWNERSALSHWGAITGQTAMDAYLFSFVKREIDLRSPADQAAWQSTLSKLFAAALKTGIVAEGTLSAFQVQVRNSRNSEEALMACINACARATKKISSIVWPELTSFGRWLNGVRGQRTGPQNGLILSCLSHLDLTDIYLDIQDLYGANLENSKFVRAKLRFVCLRAANLRYADFSGAMLQGAEFDHAEVEGAVFDAAHFLEMPPARVRGRNPKLRAILEREIERELHRASAKVDRKHIDAPSVPGAPPAPRPSRIKSN